MFIPLLFPKDTSSYTIATGNVGTKIWNPRASIMTVSNSAQLGMFLQVRHALRCCCLQTHVVYLHQQRCLQGGQAAVGCKFVRTRCHKGPHDTCLAYPEHVVHCCEEAVSLHHGV